MNKKLICATPIAIAAAIELYACGGNSNSKPTLSSVKNVVVIYAENRSFDNLYGNFPGANGLQNVTATSARQLDRDGSVLATLPPVWKGLTAAGVTPVITQAMTVNLPNSPFAIDDPAGFNAPLSATTRDLYHRFYENQMQIHGGKNDMFAAWADSGGLVMGHYTPNADKLPLYKIAQQFTLADNFFMGAFGGSFLNHQWLACACTPFYANADTSVAKASISAVEPDGVSLTLKSTSAPSALTDVPTFVNSGNLTPDFYAINTMQPPYQPSGNKPAAGGDANLADPTVATTLPAQTNQHIGDLLNNAGVTWAWYSGAWGNAISAVQNNTANVIYGANLSSPNFQPHHQPFNYFADGAGHRQPREAPARRRPERLGVHQGNRRRRAAASRVLQAARQPERARGLYGRVAGRSAHCGCDLASAEEPAVEQHGRRHHVRRERRLLGSRRAAEG